MKLAPATMAGEGPLRMGRRAAWVAAAGAVLGVLVVCHVPGLNGPWYWPWSWRHLSLIRLGAGMALLAWPCSSRKKKSSN